MTSRGFIYTRIAHFLAIYLHQVGRAQDSLLLMPLLGDCAACWPYSALRTAEPESGADGGLNDLCCCQGLAQAEKPPPVAAGDAALMADGKVSGQTSARALERQTSPSTIFSAR